MRDWVILFSIGSDREIGREKAYVCIILRTSDGVVSMNIILNVNFLIYKAIFVEPFLQCINRQMP